MAGDNGDANHDHLISNYFYLISNYYYTAASLNKQPTYCVLHWFGRQVMKKSCILYGACNPVLQHEISPSCKDFGITWNCSYGKLLSFSHWVIVIWWSYTMHGNSTGKHAAWMTPFSYKSEWACMHNGRCEQRNFLNKMIFKIISSHSELDEPHSLQYHHFACKAIYYRIF